MSDLIDRQSVLNAFDYWVKSPMIGYTNGLVRLREMFEELPPVTQEPCDDAISREDALMALTGEYTDSPIELLPKAIKRINELPPVTPSYNSVKTELDCVSRQAVLNLAKFDGRDGLGSIIHAFDVEQLPPVTAEKVGHWEWNQYDSNPKIGNWHCSQCHGIGKSYYDYCPYCKAKMLASPTGGRK